MAPKIEFRDKKSFILNGVAFFSSAFFGIIVAQSTRPSFFNIIPVLLIVFIAFRMELPLVQFLSVESFILK